MMCASCFGDAPRESSDRRSKSMDTDGSPASILATRDWLELIALASWICVIFLRNRRCFKKDARASRISIRDSSSGVSSRKSAEEPIFQPAALSFFCFVFLMTQSNSSYCLRRLLHASITRFGVFWVFLLKTSRITMASGSTL